WLITVTWAEFKKLFFLQFFPRAEQERLKREYHSIRQTNTETSTEFMQRFLRAAAGTEEEQAKNFQWGLRRNSGDGRDQRNRGQQSNRSANSGSQQSRGPSEGYSYPLRATPTRFALHCKKNTTASTSGQVDKKPGASGRVFAITEDHATKTSGAITGT
nr:zinc finger, CCHC-type, retrotransposon Gag domain protein [Tanacetum cinerariifolium]